MQKADLAWDEQLLMKFYKKALDYDADSLFFNLAVQVDNQNQVDFQNYNTRNVN